MVHDEGSTDAAGPVDPDTSQEMVETQLLIFDRADDHKMDINPIIADGPQSQWQPQSQIPLSDSMEDSSLPMSTIDPGQLHVPLTSVPEQHGIESEGDGSESSNPSKGPAAGSSRNQKTP